MSGGPNFKSTQGLTNIALTAVLCKIIEGMATDRLVYELETEGCFTPIQRWFRRRRNTRDSMLTLDSETKKAMINKKGVVS